MSKIDEVIAERKRIEALAAAAPKLPKRMLTYSTLNIAVEDDGGVCVSGASGQRLCFFARKSVPELIDFLNEWYADPAPAQPATGWRCAKTDPPGHFGDVAVHPPYHNGVGTFRTGYRINGTWMHFGKSGNGTTAAPTDAITHWHELPTQPEPSAVA